MFKPEENRLTILHDDKRGEHSLNQNLHASLISLGCVLESLSIAASHDNLKARCRTQEESLTATVEFEPTSGPEDDLYPGIETRASDRRPFKGGTLSPLLLNKLSDDSKKREGTHFYFLNKTSETLRRFISQTECMIWEYRKAHDDILGWIRFTEWERLEISSRKSEIPREHFMQRRAR